MDASLSTKKAPPKFDVHSMLIRVAALGSDAGKRSEIVAALSQINLVPQSIKKLIPLMLNKLPSEWLQDLERSHRSYLESVYKQELAAQMAHQVQIKQIAEFCEEYDLPLILLKGSALNANLYPKSAPRGCNDLDILVAEKNWKQAEALFSKRFDYAEKENPDVFGDLYELSFKPKSAVGYPIDLHKSLCHPYLFNVSYSDLWATSKEHPGFGSTNIRILGPEYHVLHLGIHAFTDMNFRNYALCDCYKLLRGADFNEPRFIEQVKSSALQVPTFQLLKALFEVFPEVTDSRLLEQVSPSKYLQKLSSALLKQRQALTARQSEKNIRYRLHQILCSHVFTGQLLKPLALQLLFIRMSVSRALFGNKPVRAVP